MCNYLGKTPLIRFPNEEPKTGARMVNAQIIRWPDQIVILQGTYPACYPQHKGGARLVEATCPS